ncbi:hypothetical protein C8R48DRAFT_729313 [Suillus tomentosus]|nr:hypothetical protein C8R48DRAFT_729313 [Suillus tomentosus]
MKRDHPTISTATNQTRTYLVSAVIFLSKLGITGLPFFGRRTLHSHDAEEDKRSNLRHGPQCPTVMISETLFKHWSSCLFCRASRVMAWASAVC